MNESMLDRLVSMENRYEELGHMLMDPDIGTDIKKMTDVTKEQASLQAAYDLFQEYKEVKDGIDGAKELMKENDPEIKEMAKMELDELEERMPDIIKKLELELIPKDPNDNKNVIMEIRGAAGGDEGNIFMFFPLTARRRFPQFGQTLFVRLSCRKVPCPVFISLTISFVYSRISLKNVSCLNFPFEISESFFSQSAVSSGFFKSSGTNSRSCFALEVR